MTTYSFDIFPTEKCCYFLWPSYGNSVLRREWRNIASINWLFLRLLDWKAQTRGKTCAKVYACLLEYFRFYSECHSSGQQFLRRMAQALQFFDVCPLSYFLEVHRKGEEWTKPHGTRLESIGCWFRCAIQGTEVQGLRQVYCQRIWKTYFGFRPQQPGDTNVIHSTYIHVTHDIDYINIPLTLHDLISQAYFYIHRIAELKVFFN